MVRTYLADLLVEFKESLDVIGGESDGHHHHVFLPTLAQFLDLP